MFDLGEELDSDDLIAFSGVDGFRGLQSGIIVNDEEKRTILIQTIAPNKDQNPYPNKWDDVIPGMIHYCATRKGISTSVNTLSMDSKLNRHVNLNIFPIYLFVRYPDKSFRFMGEFVRLPKYDEKHVSDGKDVYVFALISKNIDKIEGYVSEIKNLLK